jgi:hypothetical protein
MFASVGRAGMKSAAVPVIPTGLSVQGGVAVFCTSVVMIVAVRLGEVAVLFGLVVLLPVLADVTLSAGFVLAIRRATARDAILSSLFRFATRRAVDLVEKCRARLVTLLSFGVLLLALLIVVCHVILRVMG